MKKDIHIPEVQNVTLAVTRTKNPGLPDEWNVFLLNENDVPLENTLVASKGYGEKDGQEQMTSVLRQFLETVPPHANVHVERIDPSVFHLNNEYWVSYYIGGLLYDRRFVFVPDTLREDNLIFVKALGMEGVLHS